ncbi:hypothetical protein BH20GEM3_BH20GEM3_08510 [soil metagenome]
MSQYGWDFDRNRGRMRGDDAYMGSQRGRFGTEYDTDYGFDGYSAGMGGYNTGRGSYAGRGYGGEYMDTTDGYGFGEGGRGRGGDLGRLRAVDIMTENPETVTADATLAEAARKMRDLNVGIIPVVESEQSRRLRGVITDRDIAVRAVAEGLDVNSSTVQECMTPQVESCNKNDSVRQVMQLMQREQVRRVPITDREGRLVGIIAQADIATDLEGHEGAHMVADTVERISESDSPLRGPGGGRGGRNRDY